MDNIPSLLQLNSVLKVGFLLVLGIYTIFAVVLLIQVRSMNKLIHQTVVSVMLEVIALIHILVALSLFVAILVIL